MIDEIPIPSEQVKLFFMNLPFSKYINFYFKGKKCALHRLLYLNYVGKLENKEYLKYKCKNKGVCCNINHFNKITKKKI